MHVGRKRDEKYNMNRLTISSIKKAYASGELTIRRMWENIKEQAAVYEDKNIWIHLLTDEEIEEYISKLEKSDPDSLPLWGVPFAIKDNIDLKGIPTTAACAEYSFVPKESAFVVSKLIEAGALPVGKTNMDQFATGLVGTRSPYGEVHNAYKDELISGGSSSGSAVAVALGMVAFSLGTDTAGSGRVPASLNNLIGWKPSVGAWSNRGVVPACESIDCVTVFTNNMDDAETVDEVVRVFDEKYRYSKKIDQVAEKDCKTIYIPMTEPTFYGDYADLYRAKWNQTISYIKNHYQDVRSIDTSLFSEAASILYDGPWVAERYAGLKDYLDSHADTLFPVTNTIICGAIKNNKTAVELFTAMHRLAEIKQYAHQLLEDGVLILPTNGGTFTREQVDADPIATNSKMGLYTNHCNLLDLCAVDVPVGFLEEDLPMGITVFSKSGNEGLNAKLGRDISDAMCNMIDLAVFGLHLKGFPLETQLMDLGAVYKETTQTTSEYRMYALETLPAKPGVEKDVKNGNTLEVDIWSIPENRVGAFLKLLPDPLGLGKIKTIDGKEIIGFICQSYAFTSAKDITDFGGWRNYSKSAS